MAGLFETIAAGIRRRKAADPDPEHMQLVTAQLAQTVAIELVLKMIVSALLVRTVDDAKDQKQIDELANAFRDSMLSSVERQLVRVPDKKVAAFMDPIVRETITRLFDGAAEQVRQSTELHFGSMPSRSRN